jgi:hypothetical protein
MYLNFNRTMPGNRLTEFKDIQMRGRPRNDISVYVKQLQAFYEQHKRAPQRRDLPGHATTISKKFGSWNKALAAAGLPLRRELNPSADALRESLIKYFKTHNKSPRAIDCRKENGLYDTKTYYKILNLDSWPKVLESVNLPIYFECFNPNNRNEIEILIEVNRFIRMNRIASARKYNFLKQKQEAKLPSSTALVDRYGSWTNVLKQAGVPLNKNRYNKKLFIQKLKQLSLNGVAPSLKEFAQHLKIPARSITAHLGAFNKFVIAQGFTPKHGTPRLPSHEKKR